MIGFNNLGFDYPVLHHILLNYKKWLELTPKQIIHTIYGKAQWIIEQQNIKDNKVWVTIRDKDIIVPQLDLFKLWHFDNKAKMTSLKTLEISMNFPNVMEMPINHTKEDILEEDIESILEYNLNDVQATLDFYRKSTDKITLRKEIIKSYGLPCMSWNNGKIGENLLLELFCRKTGQNLWEVKKMRSNRLKIALNECIPNNIVFQTKEFNNLLQFFKKQVVSELKGSIGYSVIYKNCKYDYGTGGLHALYKPGTFESSNSHILKSLDVSSLYPNLAIVYAFYPEHLGKEFLEVYKDEIINVRLGEKAKPKNEQNKAIIDGYKEAANIPYGKSNEKFSFLYDPLYTLKTTISGQLVLSMLSEQLAQIPDSQILMVNTDGLEIIIPREYENVYEDICKKWQELTKLKLEFVDYSKMWIGDINNYGALTTTGKIKSKGRFEVDKVVGSEPAYHKDNSFIVIPLALQEYFSKGTPVEQTITNHKNIYDFCGRQKFKGKDYGQIHYLKDNIEVIEKQQKNTRYYISNNGSTFIKQYGKGTNERINDGYTVTIFNKFIDIPWEEYNINYAFYIKECNKEINNIETKQLQLL